jgi:signal transduction histidine kinase
MPYPFKTIRTKLVVMNLVVFGIIQIAVSILISGLRARELRRTFDRQLVYCAIRDCTELRPEIRFEPNRLEVLREKPDELQIFGDYFLEIRNFDGSTLFRSMNLGNQSLPWSTALSTLAREGPAFETFGGADVTRLLGGGKSLRLAVVTDNASPPHVVLAAANRAVIEERIQSLQEVIFTATPIGLIAVGLASFVMARRAFSPIGRIARQAQDLTAQHLARRIEIPEGGDEISEMVVVINEMLDRLQGAFEAQKRFIADAAHELKTPLTLLLGKAQVLAQRDRTTQEYKQFMEVVETETRRLGRIVESLLVLARVDAGLPLPRMDPISINEVVMDAVHECRAYAEPRQVRIVPHLADPENEQDSPMVCGDPELLLIMFSNIIRNAIRFSPLGEAVDIRIDQPGDSRISIVVRDRGPGIPQLHLDRLFERFYQAPEFTDGPQGSGLGLAIAQGVARLHGGSITVANMSEGGCAVLFHFSCAKGVK